MLYSYRKFETSKIGATEIVLPDEAIQRKTEKNETLEEENQVITCFQASDLVQHNNNKNVGLGFLSFIVL